MKRNPILTSLRANLSHTIARKPFATLLASCLLAALVPSAQAVSDTWVGSISGEWTNSANWLSGNVPGTADTATFNAVSGNNIIDLSGGATNLTLLFDGSPGIYTIGAGGVGAQSLFLDTAGGITLNSSVANPQLFNASVSLAADAAATATILNNASAGALTLAGGVVVNSGSGNGLLTVGGTNNILVTGGITNAGAGNVALLKSGPGTATISGAATFSGNAAADVAGGWPLRVGAGTLVFNGGSNVVNGEMVIGGVTGANGNEGQDATLIVNSGYLQVSSWLSVGRGNGTGTVASVLILNNDATVEAANFSAGYANGSILNYPTGLVTLNGTSRLIVNGTGDMHVGEGDGGNGDAGNRRSDFTMTINSGASLYAPTKNLSIGRSGSKGTVIVKGTATVGSMAIGWSSAGTSTNRGTVIVDGGTLLNTGTGSLIVGVGGSGANGAFGKLTITNGGTVTVFGGAGMILEQWDTGYAELNVDNGGLLKINNSLNIDTFQQNGAGTNVINLTSGGAITFYSDNGTVVGGTGAINMQSVANNAAALSTINLDGGTLTVPQIISSQTAGRRIVNFNGGTLAAATDGLNLLNLNTGNSRANVRNGGAIISSGTNNVRISQALLHSDIAGDAAIDGGLTKTGTGTLTLTNTANTYTGDTRVQAGTLALTGTATINSSSNIIISTGATLDVSAKTGGYTVATYQPLYSSGTVNGTVTTINGSQIYVGLDATGGYATNTFNNSITVATGAELNLDLGTGGARDRINVAGSVTLNPNVNQATHIQLKAPSGATNLDPTDYVLINSTNLTGNAIIQWDVAPANVLKYWLDKTATQLVLRYSPTDVPQISVTVSPSPVERTNSVKVTANVIAVASLTGVTMDLSALDLGTVSLVLSNGNVWTNSFVLPTTALTGEQLVVVKATDTSSTGTGYATLTVLGSGFVWDGDAVDSLWTSAGNWTTDVAPYPTGNFITFSNSTDTNAVMDSSYHAYGITFDSSAPSYILTNTAGSVLTLSSNGIVNNSASAQRIALPMVISGTQPVNANTGDVTISGLVSGTGGVSKSGSGAVTLANANTYTGDTTLSAGTMNINNNQAIGTAGTLTINGGTLDNTSAGNVTVVSNKPVTVAADVTFTGTKTLSFGAGAVTLAGSGTSRQITVSSNKLEVGIMTGTGGSGYGLTKTGAGTLTLGAQAGGGNSILGGDLAINGGTVQMWQDVTANGLTGTGIFENGSPNAKWLFIDVTNGVSKQFDGILRNGGAGRLGLIKQGGGTLTLTNAANYVTDNLEVRGGKLVLDNAGFYARSNGNNSPINGALEINGANVRYYSGTAPSISVGSAASTSGRVRLSSGTLTLNGMNLAAGGNTAYGAVIMTGGIVTNGARMSQGNSQGANGATSTIGVFDQSGGTYLQSGGDINQADNFFSYGIINLSGNAVLNYRANSWMFTGDQGFGLLNILGNAQMIMTNSGPGIMINANTSGSGHINLNSGGTLVTKQILGTNANNRILSFNGGTLKANSDTSLITNLSTVLVYTNGAIIDDGGFNVRLDQAMDTTFNVGGGIMSIPVTFGGSNYICPPVVQITNSSGGQNATAIAQVNYELGTVTNVIVTCPGRGYSSGDIPTPYFLGGGGAGATCGPAVVVDAMAPDGGLTKVGSGTLTIAVAQNYNGATRVYGGTLASANGALINMKDLIVSNGTFRTKTTDGTIYPQSVTFRGASTLAIDYGVLGAFVATPIDLVTSGGLLTNSGATVSINITGTGLQLTTYVLINRGSSLPTNGFALGTMPNGVTGYLTNSGTSLDLVITKSPGFVAWYGGDVTSGLANSNWTINNPTNWYSWLYPYTGSGEQYLPYREQSGIGDNVYFSDGSGFYNYTPYFTGSAFITNVTLNTTVIPANMTVDSASGTDYVISGAGSIGGIGRLYKTNTSTLYLNTVNTYSGGTVIDGGTVQVNNDNALGSSNSVAIGNNATLRYNATSASARNIGRTAGATIGLSPNATLAMSGTNGGSGNLTLDIGNNATATLSGAISGTGRLIKTNLGTAVLTAATNSYTSLTIVNGGTLTISSVMGSLEEEIEVAPNSNEVATLNITAGAVVNAQRMILAGNSANNGSPGSATLNQSGGILNSRQWFAVGSGAANALSSGTGIYNLSGGVANMIDEAMEVGNFLNAYGTVNLSGSGSLNLLNNEQLRLGSNPGSGGGTFNQTGGTVTFYSDGGTNMGGNGVLAIGPGTQTNTFIYNLDGGVLRVPQIEGGVNVATRVFNFDGGTLQAVKSNPNFMFGLTHANVQAGGAIIDTTSNNITISQALLSGGGGLTKLGTGSLTLTGSNTFTGTINVSAGSLMLTPAHQSPNVVTVANSASFGTIEGSAVTVGNVTVGDSFLQFQLTAPSSPVAPIMNVSTLTVNGAAALRVVGNVKAGAYPLLGYITIGGSGSINPVVQGSQGIVGTVYTNGNQLWVNITDIGGIVWDGTNPDVALTNLWDLSGTTNWLVGGSTQTFYSEPVAPGDAVKFTDIGTGLVLLSNAVSPNSIIFSNETKSYTIQGPGSISGTTGITKDGAGSATISLAASSFSGDVAVSNGSLAMPGGTLPGKIVISTNAGAALNITSAATVGQISGGAGANGTLAFGGTLTLGGNNFPIEFNGNVNGGTQGLTKNGTNSLTWGDNVVSNTGTITWNGGSLTIKSNASWISGAVNYNTGGGIITNAGYWRAQGAFNKYNTNDLYISGTLTNTTGNTEIRYGTMTLVSNANFGIVGEPRFGWNANESATGNIYGNVFSSQWLCIGGNNNGVGVVNIYPGAFVNVGNSTIAANGGTNHFGTINMYGGVYTNRGTQHIGESGSGTGTFNQFAGNTGFGTFNLGNNPNNTGIYNMYGGNLIQRNNTMQIGFNGNITNGGGTGVFTITNGFVDLQTMLIQHQMGTGVVNLVNGTLRVRNQLSLGSGTTGVENGRASFTIGSGGTLIVNQFWAAHGGGATGSEKNAYITNYGSIVITNGGYIDFGRWDGIHGEFEQNAGSVKFFGNSSFRFNGVNGTSVGWFNQNGGDVLFYSDAGLTPGGSGYLDMDFSNDGGSSTNTYNLNAGVLSIPRIRQTGTNSIGTINLNGGTLKAAASSAIFMQGLTAVNVNNPTIIDTTNNSITILQPLQGGGSLTKTGTGALLLNGTNLYGGTTTISGGTLGGSGNIPTAATLDAGSILSPGGAANTVGTLTFDSSLTMNSANMLINVNKSLFQSNDVVTASSAIYNGAGTLTVSNIGSALVIGDKFKVFSGTLANGGNMAVTGGGMTWSNALAATGEIVAIGIAPTIPTAPTNMVFYVTNGTDLHLEWPASYLGWLLQAQTNNPRNIGLSNNWFIVPGSGSITSTNIPLNKIDQTTFFRMVNTNAP